MAAFAQQQCTWVTAPLIAHGVLSPGPLVPGVDEACVFCSCTSPSADLCLFWEKAILCTLCVHTQALWFKAHTCTRKANRNCMKFSWQRIGVSSLYGQDCVCFKLSIFLFTFLLIYITAREDAQVGNFVLDLGEWQSLCI